MNSQEMREAFVNWANDQGLETWERIAAQAAWMAATDRFARLCEAKDIAYNQLKETTFKSLDYANEEMRELETKVLMQAEALKLAQISSCSCMTKTNILSHHSEHCLYRILGEAISATAETVVAWRAKETEPLRREVAMLREYSSNFLKFLCAEETHPISSSKLRLAIADTQATALAYEREVENRGAVKALEDAAGWFESSYIKDMLNKRAAELLAEAKRQGANEAIGNYMPDFSGVTPQPGGSNE